MCESFMLCWDQEYQLLLLVFDIFVLYLREKLDIELCNFMIVLMFDSERANNTAERLQWLAICIIFYVDDKETLINELDLIFNLN